MALVCAVMVYIIIDIENVENETLNVSNYSLWSNSFLSVYNVHLNNKNPKLSLIVQIKCNFSLGTHQTLLHVSVPQPFCRTNSYMLLSIFFVKFNKQELSLMFQWVVSEFSDLLKQPRTSSEEFRAKTTCAINKILMGRVSTKMDE